MKLTRWYWYVMGIQEIIVVDLRFFIVLTVVLLLKDDSLQYSRARWRTSVPFLLHCWF
jgi:hypothetical protein